jgi:hypothetical protein
MQTRGQPISLESSLAMFGRAGVDRERLLAALRIMGTDELPKPLRAAWSADNPTRNYCYVIAEWVKHWHSPEGSISYSLAVDDPAVGDTKHYFIGTADGEIIDLAAEQFSDYTLVRYHDARRQPFRTPLPSRRARKLDELYRAC